MQDRFPENINKRRKPDTNLNSINFYAINLTQNQPFDIFKLEINKCKNLESIAEFISNDSRLFYTKEQTIIIINKILEIKAQNMSPEITYYS